MNGYNGPEFQQVEQIQWCDLEAQGGFQPRARPLLVKGAVNAWAASKNWTFERLAQLRRADGSAVVTSFQNGLVEQGVTREPVIQETAPPYLRELAHKAADIRAHCINDIGLLPNRQRLSLDAEESFYLDWSYLKTFTADKVYLAQWNILDEFPQLRDDFEIEMLWPGQRWTWEYTFIGPAETMTGLHYDLPNNWFCQISGVKEFLLFPPEQSQHLCKSKKYDWGATLSDIDISRLDEQSVGRAHLAKAQGLYARVETGDALFIPSKTWHAVVALEPSISLAVFGLSAQEVFTLGVPLQMLGALHSLRLYRWGNCTCHKMRSLPPIKRATA